MKMSVQLKGLGQRRANFVLEPEITGQTGYSMTTDCFRLFAMFYCLLATQILEKP